MADAENKPTRKRAPKVLKVSDTGVAETKPKTPRSKPVHNKKPAKEAKLNESFSKEQLAEKVEQSKQLSNLIKELGNKNTPTTDAQAAKLAKDTIKLVTEAQRSGSLAFKRESTKALVQIRTAVDKMAFAKDAAKNKLIADIDSVVLDTKNVTMYMESVAKAQVEIIKANGKAEAKQIKQNAINAARVTRNEAKAEAKRLSAEAALTGSIAAEKAANELKAQRAEQVLRIRRIRLELQDREKRQKAEEALREQEVKDQKLLMRRKEAEMILDYRNRKAEAAARIDALYEEIKTSQKGKKDDKRNSDAHGFLGKVKEGVNDANPLLALGVTIVKGLKDTAGMMLEKQANKRNRIDPAEAHERIERISGPRSRLGNRAGAPTPAQRGGSPGPAAPRAGGVPPTSGAADAGGAGGGLLGGIMSMIEGFGGFLGAISKMSKVVLPLLGRVGKAIPGIGLFVTAVMAVFDFIDGFNNAGKMFDTLTPSTMQKIFGGLTSVVSGILGIIDTVAGWFGFDLDLAGFYKDSAAKVYNIVTGLVDQVIEGAKGLMESLLTPYRFMSGKIADLLSKLPFMSESDSSIQGLRAFAKGGNKTAAPVTNAKPAAAPAVAAKTNEVAALKDKADNTKAAGGNTAVVDNSVKSSNTTIVAPKMSTRTNERDVRGSYSTLG